jgi:hypothetical protein
MVSSGVEEFFMRASLSAYVIDNYRECAAAMLKAVVSGIVDLTSLTSLLRMEREIFDATRLGNAQAHSL